MRVTVNRPLRCPVCRTELVYPDDDCLVVAHCYTCGNTWAEHQAHQPLHRRHHGEHLT